MPLHGVHKVGQRRPQPLATNAVRGLPDHDDSLAYGLIVDAPAHDLLPFLTGGLPQEPDTMLAVVAGYRRELVENPAFLLLQRLLVPVPDSRHKFLLRHLGNASAHVVATRIFGSILAEATASVE